MERRSQYYLRVNAKYFYTIIQRLLPAGTESQIRHYDQIQNSSSCAFYSNYYFFKYFVFKASESFGEWIKMIKSIILTNYLSYTLDQKHLSKNEMHVLIILHNDYQKKFSEEQKLITQQLWKDSLLFQEITTPPVLYRETKTLVSIRPRAPYGARLVSTLVP